MVSYSVSDQETDFVSKKAYFDNMLAQARKDQKQCSYGILKEYNGYANAVSYEHIYTFAS